MFYSGLLVSLIILNIICIPINVIAQNPMVALLNGIAICALSFTLSKQK